MIRAAVASDAEQILAIYNYYIANTTTTFEEELVTADEIAKRISEISENYPFIVYEEDGKILGYAYGSQFRKRIAYRFTVETSVYVDHKCPGRGIGKALYQELLDMLSDAGFHRAMGVITLPNPTSVRFHEDFGFVEAGRFHEVGRKFDQWLDVGFYEKKLK